MVFSRRVLPAISSIVSASHVVRAGRGLLTVGIDQTCRESVEIPGNRTNFPNNAYKRKRRRQHEAGWESEQNDPTD